MHTVAPVYSNELAGFGVLFFPLRIWEQNLQIAPKLPLYAPVSGNTTIRNFYVESFSTMRRLLFIFVRKFVEKQWNFVQKQAHFHDEALCKW